MDAAAAWVALAVAVFWALGAYNRMMRLRSQAIAAFVTLDRHLEDAIALVGHNLTAASQLALAQQLIHRPGEREVVRAELQRASSRFDAALKASRRQPLDAEAMAELRNAHVALQAAWARAQQEYRGRQAVSAPSLQPQWSGNALLVAQAIAAFNQAVLAHNTAIAQFPALLLAHLFGFRPAGYL